MNKRDLNTGSKLFRKQICLLALLLLSYNLHAQSTKKIDPKKLYKKTSVESNENKKNELIEQYLNIIDSIDNKSIAPPKKELSAKTNTIQVADNEKIGKHVNHIYFGNNTSFSVQIDDELLSNINRVQYKKQGKSLARTKVSAYDTLRLKNNWILAGFNQKKQNQDFSDRNQNRLDGRYLDQLFPGYESAMVVAEEKENEPLNANMPIVFSELKTYAEQYLGTPYRGGAIGPNAFDCSGFTQHIYQNFGVSLPHSSGSQANIGVEIDKDEVQPGDLLFFKGRNRGSNRVGHVGIVSEIMPDGTVKMIHASTSRGVMIDKPFEAEYYKSRYLSARRVLNP